MGGPTWMYRKGEAAIFASPEQVPAGEGWQDTPVPPDANEPDASLDPAEAPKRRGRPPKAQPEADQ